MLLSLSLSLSLFFSLSLPSSYIHTLILTQSFISSKPYWTASVSNDMCYKSDNVGCSIFISFCGALPLALGEGCYGAAICQVGMSGDGSSYSYSMGLYKTAKYAYSELESHQIITTVNCSSGNCRDRQIFFHCFLHVHAEFFRLL